MKIFRFVKKVFFIGLTILSYFANANSPLTCISMKNQECKTTQPANIGPQDVPRTSPSNVPRTFPKDPIWPPRGRPNLTSWGRPEMTSRGRPNLTFKGRPWKVDLGHPQDVLSRSLRGFSEYSKLNIPAFFVTFLSELIQLTKSI